MRPLWPKMLGCYSDAQASQSDDHAPTDTQEKLDYPRMARVVEGLTRAIVFQCPASFTPTPTHIRDLRVFFKAIAAQAAGLRPCWESRGEWRRSTALAIA